MASRSSSKPLSIGTSAILAATLAAPAVFGQPADRARTEALARRATERLQALQREADRLAAQERTLIGDLRKLELERQLKAEELKQVDAKAARIEADRARVNERIEVLQKADLDARPELRARLVEMYKLGQARYVRMLLSTSDLRQMGQASRTVAALAKLDRDRVESHKRTLADLTTSRRDLEARGRELDAARAEAAKAESAAARAAQARNDLIRDIDRRRDLNAQLAGELQAAQAKLQTALRDVSNTAAGDTLLPLRPFRGELDWPVAGPVLRKFARPSSGASSSSNGIEIAAPEDAAAAAIHEGTVAFAGPFAGFGNLVILDHGSQAFSLYGDLLDIAVKKGSRVDRGQAVGTVGATSSGAPGLYFELRIDGQPVDPLQWLKRK